jgi:hypothetical protein
LYNKLGRLRPGARGAFTMLHEIGRALRSLISLVLRPVMWLLRLVQGGRVSRLTGC